MYHKKNSKHTLSATNEKKKFKPQIPNQNQNKLNSIEINKDPNIFRFNSNKECDTKDQKQENITESNTKKDKKIISINLVETNKIYNQNFSRSQKNQKISDMRPVSSKRLFNMPLSPNTVSKNNKNNNEINWEKSKSNNNMKIGNKNIYILNNNNNDNNDNNYNNTNVNDSVKKINCCKLLNDVQNIQELDSEENDEKKYDKNNKNINVIINLNSPNKKTSKNINENNNKINRNLLLYSQKGDREKVLEILSNENTNINYQNENGWSALHYACDEGNLKIVEILIKAHINVNIKNNDKKTPLHISVYHGYFDISKLLIENGADINVRDNEQNLPIHICSASGYSELLDYLLQKNPSLVNSKNLFGNTPLEMAKNKDIKIIIEKYLKNNNINNFNKNDHFSSNNNYLNINEQTSKIIIHKANQKQIKALIMPFQKNNALQNNDIDYSTYYGNNDSNNNNGIVNKKNDNNNLLNDKKISSSSCKKKIIFNINITNNSASNFQGKENNLYYNTSSQIRKNSNNKNQFLIEVNQTYNSPLYVKKSKDFFFSNKNVKTSTTKNKIIAEKKDNKLSKIVKNLYDKEISGVTIKNNYNSNNNTNANTTKNLNENLNINISENNTYTCINNQLLKKTKTKGMYFSDNLIQNVSPKKIKQKTINISKNQPNINGGKILKNNLNNSNNNTNNQYFTSHRTISLPGFIGKTHYCANLNNSNKKDLSSNINESNSKQKTNNNENKYTKKNFPNCKGKSLYKKIIKNNKFEFDSKKVFRHNNTIEKFNKNMSACAFEKNKSKKNKDTNKETNKENITITINKTNKNHIKNTYNNNKSTQKEIKISKIYTDEDGENDILIDDLDEEEEIKLQKNQKNNQIKNMYNNIENNENDENILNNNNTNEIEEDSLSNYESEDSNKEEKIRPSNFICLALLGQGSFGEVYLVKKKNSDEYYAMKVLDKKRIEIQNIFKYAMTERNVLSIINFPFIVKLNYAFQTKEKLFLLLDYCPGGDLSKQLQIQTRFSEDMAKFYICEISLALGELHKKDIIFRDLKPDNIVIDKEGHAMLTDFGLSREGVNEKQIAKSFCGSIAYLAPEMLSRKGHGKAVDWYLLGVCFYEMLVGIPPYFSNNQEQIFKNIEKADLYIPSFVSKNAQILIRDLLKKNPNERLGSKNDVEDIKKHPYFKGINWDMVYLRKYTPPPIIQKAHYLKFFDHPKIFVDDYDESNDLFEEKNEEGNNNSFKRNIYEGWSFVQCPNNDKDNCDNKNKNGKQGNI